jgi:putative ABC transport system permease protein
VLKVALKGTWAHKRRMVGTIAAVVLGVAFLAGTLVLGDTMRAGFDELFTDATAGTDAVVRGRSAVEADELTQPTLLDASVLDDVRAVDSVADAEPEILGLGQLLGSDGEPIGGNGPPTLASNWIDNPELSSVELVRGDPPSAPNEVVIDTTTAETGGLDIGDTTIVRTPAPIEVTIVGLSQLKEGASTSGVTYTAFTLDAARDLLVAGQDKVTDILVAAEPGVSQSELAERISAVLPSDAEAITGEDLAAEFSESIEDDFLGLFERFLVVFAVIALLVAAFSIYNTFTITVAQRIRESALLRAIGSSRGQILASVFIEALIIGIVASAIGLVAGIGLAVALSALLDAFGFGIPTAAPVLAGSTVAWAFAVGIGVTLLAGIVPAVRASRVSPLAALRDVGVDRSHTSVARAVIGAVLTIGGIALVVTAALGSGGVLTQAAIGAILLVVGVVVLGPIAARPVSALLGRPLPAVRGVTGALARQNAMRNPRRTAGTAAALMVGVAVVTMFTVMAASIKATLDDRVSRSFGGDLVVAAGGFSGSGIDPELAGALGELDEVDEAVGVGLGAAVIDGESRTFTVTDPAAATDMLGIGVVEGSMADVGDTEIAISEDEAEAEDWSVGSPVELAFSDGQTEEVTVAAVFESRQGDAISPIVVPVVVWAPHTTQLTDTTVLVRLADGVALSDGEAAVTEVAEAFGQPDVQTRDEYVDSIASGVDTFLYFVYALLALAILIALMGIANTLSLSVYERTRELGLLRAVGQTRSQTRTMVRWESVIIALFGTLGGLGLGTFLGWALLRALAADEGVGVFAAPIGQLVIVLAFGALVGLLAAVRPARRAARLDVLAAIATE